MDEKMKITLEKYVGDINDLDWSTEQIQAILSLLEEKEKNIEGLEATLYVEEETHLDLIRRAEKAETRIKELGIEFDGLHQIIEELTEERDGYKEALNVRKKAIDQATSGIGKLNERIKDLKEGIESILGESTISFTVEKELRNLLKERR